MNVIESAVNHNRHITKIDSLKYQTWEKFYTETADKKIFLFGLGSGALYLVYKCSKKICFDGVIDNDKSKQGYKFNNFFSYDAEANVECTITDISILDGIDPNKTAVVITSTVYYEEIYAQLQEIGINNIYSLLHMELNGNAYSENNNIEKEYKINDKKLIFYTRGSYSGHSKYIAEALLNIRNDLELVWIVNDISISVPEGIRKIDEKMPYIVDCEMKTSKVWIYETLIPPRYVKAPEQIYIQTKHWSSITLKTFGIDLNKFRNSLKGIEHCQQDGAMMDYMFFGSDFDEETCRRGYNFQGRGIRVGSPRSDILFNSVNIRKNVYNSCGIDEKIHTLLYAPTFSYVDTDSGMKEEMRDIDLDFAKLKKTLEIRFGGEWNIMLRLHPWVAAKSKEIEKPEYVIDVSDYQDSQELVAASDIMITDYSSIMFEPAFVHKPVFLFASDRNNFINVERELLIDYDTLPFPIAENNDELSKNIVEFNMEMYVNNVDLFMKKYGVNEDGHASERAAKFISDLIGEKEE